MTAMEILVIILSIFLTIFLVIGSILVILLIRVTRQIKRVTTSAEHAVSNVEGIINGFSKVAKPAMVAKLIMNIVSKRSKK